MPRKRRLSRQVEAQYTEAAFRRATRKLTQSGTLLPLTCKFTEATLHLASRNQGELLHSYFKGQWPDNPVPKGEPQWIYYEVEVARDVVSRIVEQFVDGSFIRNSVDLAEREGSDQRDPKYRSLVQGPFLECMREHLTPITSSEFGLLWGRSIDKPWPPE